VSKRLSTRRCICCRQCADKEELLRFVLRDCQIVWDKEQKLPGRGAYVHSRLECWSSMASSKLWERAYRLKKGELIVENLKACMDDIKNSVEELSEASVKSAENSRLRL